MVGITEEEYNEFTKRLEAELFEALGGTETDD